RTQFKEVIPKLSRTGLLVNPRDPEIAAASESNLLVKFDRALDLKRETYAAKCHRRLCWQLLAALELTLRQALSYCLLDLALGTHAQPFEKLSDAGVENVLVHHHLRIAPGQVHFSCDINQSPGKNLPIRGRERKTVTNN